MFGNQNHAWYEQYSFVEVGSNTINKVTDAPDAHQKCLDEDSKSPVFVKSIVETNMDHSFVEKHRHDSTSSFIELEAPAASVDELAFRNGPKMEMISTRDFEYGEPDCARIFPTSMVVEADTTQKIAMTPISSSSSSSPSSSSTASTPQSIAPEVDFVERQDISIQKADQDTQFIILNREESEIKKLPTVVPINEDEDEAASISSSSSSSAQSATSSEDEEDTDEADDDENNEEDDIGEQNNEKEDNEEDNEEEDSGTESSKEEEFYKIKQNPSPKFILLHNNENALNGNSCFSPAMSKSRVVSIGGSSSRSSSSSSQSSPSSQSSSSSSSSTTPKSHIVDVNRPNHPELQNYKSEQESSIMTSDVFTSTCETQEDFKLNNTNIKINNNHRK